MSSPLRVAVNGVGKVGMYVLKYLLTFGKNVEVVFINDPNSLDTDPMLLAVSFSQHLYHHCPKLRDPRNITVNDSATEITVLGQTLKIFRKADFTQLSLDDIDVVVDASGCTRPEWVAHALGKEKDNPLRWYFETGPNLNIPAVVWPFHLDALKSPDGSFRRGHFTCGSCIISAIASLLTLVAKFEIDGRKVTVVAASAKGAHGATRSQSPVDMPGSATAKKAGAVSNIVGRAVTPIEKTLGELLRHPGLLQDRPDGEKDVSVGTLRVPVRNRASFWLTVHIEEALTAHEVNQLLRHTILAEELGDCLDPEAPIKVLPWELTGENIGHMLPAIALVDATRTQAIRQPWGTTEITLVFMFAHEGNLPAAMFRLLNDIASGTRTEARQLAEA